MPILDSDANLERAKQIEGYKVLPPCVLYGRIGQGGMGAVYRGRHLNLDIDVAVKCLKPELVAGDDQFVLRFRREARAAAQINHQNVVRVFDVSEEQGLHYIVMELVQGETARERVQRKKRLGIGEALAIVWGAAMGLGEAHRKGFVHRDMKPDNIMISSSGQVKVADLGLAKPARLGDQASLLSGTNVVMGTPQYMPPEQWESTATVTPAADVWALGATLYYLLVGGEAIAKDSLPRIMQRIVLQPFPDVRERRPEVPADVAALIAKATAKAPEERFHDGQELADAIDALATRRDALRDRDAAPTSHNETLVSPPPAKTLAKIKLWLDEHAQTGAGEAMTVAAGAGRTQPMPRPVAPRRGVGPLALVVAVLVVAAAVFAYWRPWRTGGLFAEADRLAAEGRYELAIAETLRVHEGDPSLAGKEPRLARLHAAWAQQLLDAGDYRACWRELAASLAYADTRPARDLERAAQQRVAASLANDLQRVEPGAAPVAPDAPVVFRGRLASDLVTGLRIAEQPVERAPDGGFEVSVALGGAAQADVAVTLVNGASVALPPWRVNYTAPLQTLDVEVTPARVELVDEQPSSLTIKAPRAASVFVDGQPVPPAASGDVRVHRVQSDRDEPSPLVVRVQQAGCADFTREVPVARRLAPLAFVRAPGAVGLRELPKRGFVTADEAVRVAGQLSEAPARFLINGVEATQVEWGERGAFVLTAPTVVGENRLRIEATRRFRTAAVHELMVTRLVPPRLEPVGGTRAKDRVSTLRYEIAVAADAWTARVVARRGSAAVPLVRDADADVFRGAVPLDVGANTIQIEARNVLDQAGQLTLEVERLASSARPEITGVEFVGDGETGRVARDAVRFVPGARTVRATSSDPAAQWFVNGKPASADGSFSVEPFLEAGKPARIEVRCENGAGSSAGFVFFVVLDVQPPKIEVQPVPPVAAGRPFTLSGTWSDDGWLASVEVVGQAATLVPTAGASRSGRWTVQHPGLAATGEVQLVVVDQAGHRVTVPVQVEVR